MKKWLHGAMTAMIVLFTGCGGDSGGDSGGDGGGDGGGVVWNNGVLDLGDGVRMELVWIPAGTFVMGSPTSEAERNSDETQHTVTISRGFWMGKYEVTQEQWTKVMGYNPSNLQGAQNPVEMVTWIDCQTFIQQLNTRVSGGGFRLPTESEWEYACRAGTETRFYTGDSTSDLARAGWYDGNADNTTHPVGQKQSNGFGLYDMHGNVWEWCQDLYGTYPSGSVTDPINKVAPSSDEFRVVRGGSCLAPAGYCRSAVRFESISDGPGVAKGFRLASD